VFKSIVPNARMVLNSIRGVSGSITISIPTLKPATLFVWICNSPCSAGIAISVAKRLLVVEALPASESRVLVVDVTDGFGETVRVVGAIVVEVVLDLMDPVVDCPSDAAEVVFGSEVVLDLMDPVVDCSSDAAEVVFGSEVVLVDAVVDCSSDATEVVAASTELVVVDVVDPEASVLVEAGLRSGTVTDATWTSRGRTDDRAMRMSDSDVSEAVCAKCSSGIVMVKTSFTLLSKRRRQDGISRRSDIVATCTSTYPLGTAYKSARL